MTSKKFFNSITGRGKDILRLTLGILSQTKTSYCVIGGLAVNAYAEPVVSLDLDLVVSANKVDAFCNAARQRGLKIKAFRHSVNLTASGSDLRVQIQTDARYQPFISRAKLKTVLGYRLKVAAVEDVLRGKLWAYQDTSRRQSKRQKDLADILRLLERFPSLRKNDVNYLSLMHRLRYARPGRKFSRDELNER